MTGVAVGASGSAGSAVAVRWAAAEAELRSVPLTLLHAWNVPFTLSLDLPAWDHPDVDVPATSLAVHGDPAEVLLRHEPSLLVLGPGAVRDRLSPLARRVLREARGPVVVVHGSPRPRSRRVVVGVCGTPASRHALRWAAEEARLRAAELVVVHSWQARPASLAELVQPSRAVARQQLPALERLRGWVVDVLGRSGAEDATLRAQHGGTLDALLDAASDADLLVLGRSEHGMLHRLVLGAVGDDVSGLARCSVAVVPGVESREPALA